MGLITRLILCLIYIIYHSNGLPDLETQICVKYGNDISQLKKPMEPDASSFEKLLKDSVTWIDKSLLIHRIVTKPEKFLIIICPRRWGKSINLSMLKLFYNIPVDSEGEFIDIEKSFSYNYFTKGEIIYKDKTTRKSDNFPFIAAYTDLIDQFLGKHPVVYVDFSRFDANYWFSEIKVIMQKVYTEHSYVDKIWREIDANENSTAEDKFNARVHSSHYMNILCGKCNDIEEMSDSISWLIRLLYQYHGKTVVICLDDFEAYANSLYFETQPVPKEKATKLKAFFRSFMDKTFKNSDLIEKAILTGFSRFERESYLKVSKYEIEEFNVLDMKDLFPFYGVSLNEVNKLMEKRGTNDKLKKLALLCYGGYYCIGHPDKPIFNIHSVVYFINEGKIDGFWVKSFVGNNHVFKLLKHKQFMNTILALGEGDPYKVEYQRIAEIDFNECENLRKKIDSFNEEQSPTLTKKQIDLALTSLFMEGYFTVKNDNLQLTGDPKQTIEIKIPNVEIKQEINNMVDEETKLLVETTAPGCHANIRSCAVSLVGFLTNDRPEMVANMSQTIKRLFTEIGPFSKLRKKCEHTSLKLFMSNNHDFVRMIHRWFDNALGDIRTYGYLSSVKYKFSFHPSHSGENEIDLFIYKDKRALMVYFKYENDDNVEKFMLRAINGTTYTKLCNDVTFDVIKYLVIAVHGDGQVILRWARKNSEDVKFFLHLMEKRVHHIINGTSFREYLQSMKIDYENTTLVQTLESLQLKEYYPLFKAYHLNYDCLLKLTETDLQNIGIEDATVRKKIHDRIFASNTLLRSSQLKLILYCGSNKNLEVSTWIAVPERKNKTEAKTTTN